MCVCVCVHRYKTYDGWSMSFKDGKIPSLGSEVVHASALGNLLAKRGDIIKLAPIFVRVSHSELTLDN